MDLQAACAAHRRTEPVEGSPFQPGQIVRVVATTDVMIHDVSQYLGMVGVVTYLEYDCGSGQRFPDDPMIGVEFPELESENHEEFWAEELQKERSYGQS